ncbi:MAG TPA: MBL fold metallo-hydrolase [Candidatus Angelobacter sp.]|nr:MBL fold metallo-hydrolase [Candidatus Angelobacter sp.]
MLQGLPSRPFLRAPLIFSLLPLLLMMPTTILASTHKIGSDLFAYISENDSSANSTFLITTAGILVVDTGLNDQEGRKLLAEIRKISALPVRYIVNTHYHPDHRGGNSAVGPGATIISTTFTLSQEAGRIPAYSSAPEKITFTGRIRLYLGGYEIEIYFPGPGHTMGDAVVYFPQQRAIATGDLFLTNCSPAMDQGDMENWIAILDSMLKAPIETVVPGHFELAGKEQLQRFRDYLADLRDQVSPLFHSGVPLEQVLKRLDLSKYKDFRQYPQYEATFTDNAASYYRQREARAQHH